MRKELVDSGRLPRFGQVGEVFPDRIGQGQLAVLIQKQNASRRELLGNRSRSKPSFWCVLDIPFRVCPTTRIRENGFVMHRNRNSSHDQSRWTPSTVQRL